VNRQQAQPDEIRLTKLKMDNGTPLALKFFGAGKDGERAFAIQL